MDQSTLELARYYHLQHDWSEAYTAFKKVDEQNPLGADDLELYATCACFVGLDDTYLSILERAHNSHLRSGQDTRAARCAFWLGYRLSMRGETSHANGWLARTERLIRDDDPDCAERGYLETVLVAKSLKAGDIHAAEGAANRALEIGYQRSDPDLTAAARVELGKIRLHQGRVAEGLALIDETMVSVTAGELTPLMTGVLYCAMIALCHAIGALERMREWSTAMTRWCDEQPDAIAFAGICRVHRAEVMVLGGEWSEAIEVAQHAWVISRDTDQQSAAAALYQQGEIHRLRGSFAEAEEAYRGASQLGLDPQPGLALLRLAQGRAKAAATAIRRILQTTESQGKRLGLLPSYVEIMLATGDLDDAHAGCLELDEIATSLGTGMSHAHRFHARGATELSVGNLKAALNSLRQAFEIWQNIGVPHASARARMLMAMACRGLGDEDGAGLEFDAAHAAFTRLGAAPDLATIASLRDAGKLRSTHRLTPREVQVLRHVSAGKTNAAIASELSLSERTVERHVSNIFCKLDVSTRTAATAWAYKHGLI